MSTMLSHVRSWYEVSSKPSRLISMEGTRGLAVLLVFFVHFHALFSPYIGQGTLVFDASRFMGLVGNTGVDLFFVISGYLIYGAIIRRRSSYGHFVGRRIERIYPTFLAVLGLYLVLSPAFPGSNKIHGPFWSGAWYIGQNLLLLPGIFSVRPIITVAWSLSYEFFFYLSLPLIVAVTGAWRWGSRSRVIFFGAIGTAYLAGSIFLPRSNVRLVMFVSGILLYEALSSERFRQRLNQRDEASAALLFLASLVIAYLLDTRGSWFSAIPGWTHGRTNIQGVPGYQGPYKALFLSISCFWFAAYAFGYAGWLKGLFSWSPLRYLGNMSYSYYLIHGLTLEGVAIVFHHCVTVRPRSPALYAAMLVVGFFATWISSSLLFLAVEKPMSLSPGSIAENPVLGRLVAAFSWRQSAGAKAAEVVGPAPADQPVRAADEARSSGA